MLLDKSTNFPFFHFDYRNVYLCTDCQHLSEGISRPDGKIRLQVTKDTGNFNMQNCLDAFLYNPVDYRCEGQNCHSNSSIQQFELVRPSMFLLVALVFYKQAFAEGDGTKRKLNSNCSPLLTIDIPGSGGFHRYHLEGVVEHIGTTTDSPTNHYISYIKKNNKWYRISDSIVTETTRISRQPYVSLYKLQL